MLCGHTDLIHSPDIGDPVEDDPYGFFESAKAPWHDMCRVILYRSYMSHAEILSFKAMEAGDHEKEDSGSSWVTKRS